MSVSFNHFKTPQRNLKINYTDKTVSQHSSSGNSRISSCFADRVMRNLKQQSEQTGA